MLPGLSHANFAFYLEQRTSRIGVTEAARFFMIVNRIHWVLMLHAG